MTAFRYEAVRDDRTLVRGVLEVPSGLEAAAVLSARGLYPVALEAARPPRVGLFGWGRPSLRAQAVAVQSLAALTEAGVPLDQALSATLAVGEGPLVGALERVRERVRQGASLAGAMATEAQAFGPVAIGLVRAGEKGVGLGAGLSQAAAHLERDAESRARVRAALTYPTLLAAVGSASVGLIVLYVVPRFAALLGDLGQALPTATRALLGASSYVRSYGLVSFVIVAACLAAAMQQIQAHRVRWHSWLLDVPVIGGLRHALATARAARALGALLGTGTPALQALAVAREAAGDDAVAARLGAAADRVSAGASLSAALGETHALTPAALQLVTIGEGSGKLAALLAKAATLEEQAAERRLKALVGLLEPALIIAFAGLVTFVAAALLQAVYAVRPA